MSANVRSLKKLSAKELIYVASSLVLEPKDLSLVVSENWFVVSEFFFIVVSGNNFFSGKTKRID